MITLCFTTMLALGLYCLASRALHLPTLTAGRAMTMGQRSKISFSDGLVRTLALRLSTILPMGEYKKVRLKNTLQAAGISDSPELFVSTALVKTMAVALLGMACLGIFPLIAPICLVLAVLIYLKETHKAQELLLTKREAIEGELPRFVATITQELKSSRDVLSILDHYKHSASPTFAKELDILTADMRSGSYEIALTRFEARFNSPMLSDIVRGLISVLRGDDGAVYFQMLSHDFKQIELQKLKNQAMKIPPKIRVFSFAMLMCFLFTYLVVLAYEILTSLTGLF